MNREQWRYAIYERDIMCQECGKTKEDNGRALSAHHIKPICDGGENTLDNGILFCNKCHKQRHRLHHEPMARLGIYMDDGIHKGLKRLALNKDTSINEVVVDLINKFLKRNNVVIGKGNDGS